MSLRQYFGNALLGMLPPTRAYALKRGILRGMGVRVQGAPRVVSSVRVWGAVELTLGDDTFLGHEVLISGGASRVTIGAGVDIAPRVNIVTGTHAIDMQGQHSAGRGYSQDVLIEDGAWIGAGATILGGVTIGRKAIVAAGSTVTADVAPFTLAAGVPCQPKKRWSTASQQWLSAEEAAA
jgi:maltose O-acetyltransferase